MRNHILLVLVALIAIIASVPSIHGTSCPELVTNGGFEQGTTGWVIVDIDDSTELNPFMAHTGNFSFQLGPEYNMGSISQVISTKKNTLYALSFYFLNDGNPNLDDNVMTVSVNGEQLPGANITNFPPSTYAKFLFWFTATTTSTTITFKYLNPNGYYYLDDISMESIACNKATSQHYVHLPAESIEGNLIQNGGFELLTSHWEATSPDPYYEEYPDNLLVRLTHLNPHSGQSCIQFGTSPSPGSLSQIINVVSGSFYRLSYHLANDGDGGGEKWIKVYLNDVEVVDSYVTNLPIQEWHHFEFVFQATSTELTVTFTSVNSPGYFFLDDISVVLLE